MDNDREAAALHMSSKCNIAQEKPRWHFLSSARLHVARQVTSQPRPCPKRLAPHASKAPSRPWRACGAPSITHKQTTPMSSESRESAGSAPPRRSLRQRAQPAEVVALVRAIAAAATDWELMRSGNKSAESQSSAKHIQLGSQGIYNTAIELGSDAVCCIKHGVFCI